MDQVYKPFLDRNGAKTLPFRAAHTSMAYVREYPPEAFRYTAVSGARVLYSTANDPQNGPQMILDRK